MSIVSGFLRIVKGEPVYKPDDVTIEEKQATAETTPNVSLTDVVPVVRISGVRSSMNGTYTEVRGGLQNESHDEVGIESIDLLGKLSPLNLPVAAGTMAPAVLLFSGETPNMAYVNKATLAYHGQHGSFRAYYTVEVRLQADGKPAVTKLELQLPIRKG